MTEFRKYKPVVKGVVTPSESHLKVNNTDAVEQESLLITRTANEWLEIAKKEPVPCPLCGCFWYEGELAILTADTNVGKSIFAVQIGENIARGNSHHAWLPSKAIAQQVLYCDFELSYKQFENRYSKEYTSHYTFSENFFRLEINTDFTQLTDFNDQLIGQLEREVVSRNIKVIIIDNLSFLRTESMDTAKAALPLMQLLKHLKKKHGLSILVLAHTPKRSMFTPLTRNDIAGSKQLANFADSIFAIGESVQGKSVRYIKQLKTRVAEMVYDESSVLECTIEKEFNFLKFHFSNTGFERDHLMKEADKSDLEEKILAIRAEEPNASLRDIAAKAGTNHMHVARILKKPLANSGELNTVTNGTP